MDLIVVLYLGVGSIFLYTLVSRFIVSRQRASFCKVHGCQPGRKFPQNRLLFGFNLVFKFQKWVDNGVFMQETTKWFTENGSTFEVVIAGKRVTWTSDPENIKAILASSDFDLPDIRIKSFQPFTGDSTFSSKGPVWSRGRALLRPCFSRLQLANFDIYEENFQKLCKLIPRNGSAVDLQQLFKRFTIDTASEILFGESVNSLSDDTSSKEVSAAFDKGSQGVFERGNMGIFLWMHWDPQFIRSCKTVHNYIGKFVDKAIQLRTSSKAVDSGGATSGRTRYIFLEELAKETSDRKLLRDQITGALAAGRDTTASLLSFTLWLLARHPEASQTLRREVAELGGNLPSYEQLQSMKHLQCVLNETLRLYTVIPFNSRGAERDTCLPKGGGVDGNSPVFVPKNGMLVYSSYAMHRSPDIWGSDAEDFVPERWRNPKSTKQSSKYVPFGGGSRICPGQQLALVEAAYVIVRIFQVFSVLESKDDSPFREAVAINLSLSNGVWVSLRE